MCVSKSIVLLVAILGLVSVSCFASVIDDLERLAGHVEKAKQFVETDVGYDRHADFMYYDGEEVKRHYPRAKFLNTQVSLAGQAMDMLGSDVPKAVNPFAVAQKSTLPLGQSTDRWDVKENSNGHQFFALYSGTSDFVVNKLRAHLLRRVANDVQDLLPYLDKSQQVDQIDNEAHVEFLNTVKSEIMSTIRSTIQKVDDDLRDSMDANDTNTVSATVVIVTKHYVITATIGGGRVLSYSSFDEEAYRLNYSSEDKENLFGDRKNKAVACDPHVTIDRRSIEVDDDVNEMVFLVMETPLVAKNADDKQIVNTIQVTSKKFLRDPEVAVSKQQEMFSKSAIQALQLSANSGNVFGRLVTVADHSIILIGLSDFSELH